VVTYDRPGIGNSPAPPNPGAPVLAASVADDLLGELCDRGLPGPYLLVGHWIGGLYVQAFARNHPDAVAGMVLVDASSPLEPPGVFVSTLPPKPGTVEAAEEAGVAPSVAALGVPPCHQSRLWSLPRQITPIRPSGKHYGAMCSGAPPRSRRREGSLPLRAVTSSKKIGLTPWSAPCSRWQLIQARTSAPARLRKDGRRARCKRLDW
jgi:pimeloyl-ACP methyl ester carboxylesterase